MKPVITTFNWVPSFARGTTRDLRARWAFEEEGISYDVRLIEYAHSKSAEHRRLQPFGQIPTYSDGEVELFETGAITLRIAELGRTLLPSDPALRMRAIMWVMASLNSVEPWILRAVVDMVSPDTDPSSAVGDGMSATRDPQVMKDLNNRLTDLAGALGDKQWLDGDRFTVGDLMMISVLGNLRGRNVVEQLPNLAAYVARGEERPAHVKAMGDQLALYGRPDAP